MIAIMRDGMGVGLAATQVGMLRRLLVFQAGHDSEPAALVNPEIEWRSDELVIAEEGCLSLPRVSMDVERPLHITVTGLDVDGDPVRIEAAGLEARVLQHEIDHLDGVLILDRAPAPSARARCGRCAKEAATARRSSDEDEAARRRAPRAAHRRVRTVYLGTSSFAATVLRRLGDSPHRPQLVVAPPDRPKGRGRRTLPPPVAEAARELGIQLLQADARQRRGGARADPRGGPAGGGRLRLRPDDPRAAALRAADPQRPSLAAAPLARRGADRARDHGRRRAHRGQHHAADRGPRLRSGRAPRGGGDRPRG